SSLDGGGEHIVQVAVGALKHILLWAMARDIALEGFGPGGGQLHAALATAFGLTWEVHFDGWMVPIGEVDILAAEFHQLLLLEAGPQQEPEQHLTAHIAFCGMLQPSDLIIKEQLGQWRRWTGEGDLLRGINSDKRFACQPAKEVFEEGDASRYCLGRRSRAAVKAQVLQPGGDLCLVDGL